MGIDLKGMSRKELEKLKAKIEKALQKLDAQDRKAALAAAEKAAAAHGFSLAEITSGTAPKKAAPPKSAAKAPSPPKFRNPENPEQTWSGKGRQPAWYKSAVAAGVSTDDLKV